MHTLTDEDKTILVLKYGTHIGNALRPILKYYAQLYSDDFTLRTDTRHTINKILLDDNCPCAVIYYEDEHYIISKDGGFPGTKLDEILKCIQ